MLELNNFPKIPIWLMRQAGRYLPEYKNIRKKYDSFLDLCYNKEDIVKVTIQPIERFNVDLAIIFSDILLLPHALGWQVDFEENIGPLLRKFNSNEDFIYFSQDFHIKLNPLYEAISNVKQILGKEKYLIGFAGSPWTVASYLLEGRGKTNFVNSKKLIYQDRVLVTKLINFITEHTIEHLANQIIAGCDIVKLFDSWAGVLTDQEFEDFIIIPTKRIVRELKNRFAKVPIIGFPRGAGLLYERYINETGIDIIAVDQFVPIEQIAKWQKTIWVQGNLDPVLLLTNEKIIANNLDKLLSRLTRENFIFNLGHGVLPQTPVQNVEFLVNYVRNYSKSC